MGHVKAEFKEKMEIEKVKEVESIFRVNNRAPQKSRERYNHADSGRYTFASLLNSIKSGLEQ